MSSLRARLMLGLLVLAAVALVIVDAISYLELRSYLYQRVDQQVASAIDPVSHALAFSPGGARPLPAPGGSSVPVPPGGLPPGAPRIPFRSPPPGAQPPGELQLPPGTYGFVLGPRGAVRRVPFSFGEKGLPHPLMPAHPPVSASTDSLSTFSVPASAGSSGFRAAAVRFPGSSRTLAVAIPLGDTDQTLAHLRLVGIIVTAAVLAALAALAWWVIGVGLRPLGRMTETANEIAAGDDLSLRVEATDGRTEVGRLGTAFNGMLARIEDAFARREASEARLRTFLADASHELRTPLATIRGYAELFRLGAADDPEDARTSMKRIEEESARMGIIVSDLLTLARLDEVHEPVREPVNLAEVAADAAADGRAMAPKRRIELRASGSAEVVGDVSQLRQIVSNLVANAIAHTPDGTPIDIEVDADDANATLRVRDHGPGLPDGSEARVFERFWRADGGRPGEGGGSGLGLAIVSGVAQAHGGHAEATNAADGGATFTVTIPRRAAVGAGS
jgi:two-component system OmpR family sensor kinase